jgi:hypothetical protein
MGDVPKRLQSQTPKWLMRMNNRFCNKYNDECSSLRGERREGNRRR